MYFQEDSNPSTALKCLFYDLLKPLFLFSRCCASFIRIPFFECAEQEGNRTEGVSNKYSLSIIMTISRGDVPVVFAYLLQDCI